MRSSLFLAALAGLAGAAAALAACGTARTERVGEVAFDPQDGGGAGLGPAGSGLVTGLPCDVQALLENRCIACHGATATDPPPLVDYASLTAPSRSDPSRSMAAVSLDRMRNLASPMPPPPAVPPDADEVLIFAEWLAAGTPRAGQCTEPPPDGGSPNADADAGSDGGAPCASGQRWTGGDQASPAMHPGRSCQGCHQQNGGPNFKFAGTVYRNGPHDVDDCNGATPPPALQVMITDKDGREVAIPVNAAGNFSIGSVNAGGGKGGNKGSFKAPFRVRVTDGTSSRVMNNAITAGDCNSCHTASGANGAPGRVLAP